MSFLGRPLLCPVDLALLWFYFYLVLGTFIFLKINFLEIFKFIFCDGPVMI